MEREDRKFDSDLKVSVKEKEPLRNELEGITEKEGTGVSRIWWRLSVRAAYSSRAAKSDV